MTIDEMLDAIDAEEELFQKQFMEDLDSIVVEDDTSQKLR